jgi:hypothetical protein
VAPDTAKNRGQALAVLNRGGRNYLKAISNKRGRTFDHNFSRRVRGPVAAGDYRKQQCYRCKLFQFHLVSP